MKKTQKYIRKNYYTTCRTSLFRLFFFIIFLFYFFFFHFSVQFLMNSFKLTQIFIAQPLEQTRTTITRTGTHKK